jgi:hypothetical protein
MIVATYDSGPALEMAMSVSCPMLVTISSNLLDSISANSLALLISKSVIWL